MAVGGPYRHIALSEARGKTPGHSKWDPAYVFARAPDLNCSHVFGSGDLPYGMHRAAYEAEGYGPSLLVRSRGVPGAPILDARAMTPEDIAAHVSAGYRYACLERRDGR